MLFFENLLEKKLWINRTLFWQQQLLSFRSESRSFYFPFHILKFDAELWMAGRTKTTGIFLHMVGNILKLPSSKGLFAAVDWNCDETSRTNLAQSLNFLKKHCFKLMLWSHSIHILTTAAESSWPTVRETYIFSFEIPSLSPKFFSGHVKCSFDNNNQKDSTPSLEKT